MLAAEFAPSIPGSGFILSTLTVTENFSDGNTLTATHLSTANTSIETWANGNIDSTNIAVGGVTEACLATGAVTAAKIGADAVTTVKIQDDAVNGAKIADDVIDSQHYVDGSIDAAHLAADSVETAKVADDAITWAKLAATDRATGTTVGVGGVGLSESCGVYTGSGDVTNMAVTITTRGRPVAVKVVSDGNGVNPSTQTTSNGQWKIFRDAVLVGHSFQTTGTSFPVETLGTIDFVAAGTYVYKLVAVSGGINYSKLVAFEF